MLVNVDTKTTAVLYPQHTTQTRRIFASLRLCYTALTLLLCLPILFTTYLPLVDYPNHLARVDILARYVQMPAFQAHYIRLFQPIPNLAMDLPLVLLCHVVNTITAGKLFLLGLVLLYSAGCYLLSRSIFGHETRAAFLPLLFLYNSTFLMGFINYAVGIALFLIAFALWLRWKSSWTFTRFMAFSVLASACYLSHLSSLAILGLSTAVVMMVDLLYKRERWTQALITGAAAIPALVAYQMFMHGSGHMGTLEMNTLTGKLIALLCVIRSYNSTLDLLFALGLVVCAIYIARNELSVSVNTTALAPALALFLAFVLCPRIMYTSSGADVRFVWPAFVLLALSFRIRMPSPRRTFCLGFVIALFLVRTAFIWWNWHQQDKQAHAIVQSFNKLPRGASLYPAFFHSEDRDIEKQHHGLEHVACYAVITRDAFVPSVFALRGQQPLILNGSHPFQVWDKKTFNPNEYQYLWAFNPPQELRSWLDGAAILVSKDGDSTLWRLPYAGVAVN